MEYSVEVDVLVIGSGPGGEGAAMGASKAGLRVMVVDRYASPGGALHPLGNDPLKIVAQRGAPLDPVSKRPAIFSLFGWQ